MLWNHFMSFISSLIELFPHMFVFSNDNQILQTALECRVSFSDEMYHRCGKLVSSMHLHYARQARFVSRSF